MPFISLFEIIKAVVPEPCFFYCFFFFSVIPKSAKIFFVKGTATFLDGPTDLLNNDLKNPPD